MQNLDAATKRIQRILRVQAETVQYPVPPVGGYENSPDKNAPVEAARTLTRPGDDKYVLLPEEVGVCKSCRKNPAALYVSRYGVYLPNLCVKCWRQGDPDRGNKRNYDPAGPVSVMAGRS